MQGYRRLDFIKKQLTCTNITYPLILPTSRVLLLISHAITVYTAAAVVMQCIEAYTHPHVLNQNFMLFCTFHCNPTVPQPFSSSRI